MRILDSIRQFRQDVQSQRLRTFLTILGITWGTVAVIVLLAFGAGLEKQTRKNMHGMGDGIVVMFGGQTTIPFAGFPDGRPIRLQKDDVALIRREIREIAQISPEFISQRTPARRGQSSTTPTITGVYPEYADMRNIIPETGGRFINDLDLRLRRRTIVLGDEIKRLSFGEDEAVGTQVLIGETPFVVIGVMQEKTQNSSYYSRDKDRIFMPSTTFQSVFGDRYLNNIVYKPSDPALSKSIEARVYETLGRRYTFDPADEDALGIWDTNEMDTFFKYFFIGFNIFMGIIGSFTLTVGGIGVANIMYVVVRERTREIGVKRSVGARKRDILRQFLMETFVVVSIGAVLGFVIAAALIFALGFLPFEEVVGAPAISPVVAITTISLLTLIAFFAGLFPARKAANLDPIECLRY